MRLPLWHLTLASIRNRGLATGLTLVAIALSVALLLGVERLRNDARASFANSVSGTDLIAGARGGPVSLLLYSVFHIGDATQDVDAARVDALRRHKEVAWLVPLSLGDSHRGYRVVGTTTGFFAHVRTGDRQPLRFAAGQAFDGVFDAVVGAEVAEALGYAPGARIVLSHGAGEFSAAEHADKPFTVTGVLARTGTPIDRSVLVGLAAIEAIHLDWQGGSRIPGVEIPARFVSKFDLTPRRVTAALIGLERRTAVFRLQREINASAGEPLMAILPGVTLDELWRVVGGVERALLAVSAFVVAVGLAGLVATVVSSLSARRRELAILRALGAGPGDIFVLLMSESVLLATAGGMLGVLLLWALSAGLAPWLMARHGVQLVPRLLDQRESMWLAAVVVAAVLASLVPAWRAYRYSLADGMTVRL
ncbi:MAG: ABC transporter permease [Rhodocyclales bacterium]|nr:ABC transporter permease [Rhodocyclales bacterium]